MTGLGFSTTERSAVTDSSTLTPCTSRQVFDPARTVVPAWEGTRTHFGVRITVGRDSVVGAADALLVTRAPLAFDFETCGTSVGTMAQLKAAALGNSEHVVVFDPRDADQADLLRWAIDQVPELLIHNSTFDVPLLVDAGLADMEVVEKVTDTLVTARLAFPGEQGTYSLEKLVLRVLGVQAGSDRTLAAASGLGTVSGWYALADLDIPAYLIGAALDVAALMPLYDRLGDVCTQLLTSSTGYQSHRLDAAGAREEHRRQQIVNRVMLRQQCRGFAIDHSYYEQYRAEHLTKRDAARAVLAEHGIRSKQPADLVKILHERGELPQPWPTTATGRLASDEAARKRIAGHPLVQAYETDQQVTKTLDDYLDKLSEHAWTDGRVRPQTAVLGASATGRMSAGSPPVQQFPDAGRRMILADDPHGWVSIDWSAVEPLVAAYAAGETELERAIRADGDAYVPVGKMSGLIPADMPLEEAKEHSGRKAAKVVLLGLLYGKGVALLATELGVCEEEAARIKAEILRGVPAIGRWMEQLKDGANRHGHTITAAGRILKVGLKDGKVAGYRAQNYFHQGSAYDCLVDALVEIHRRGLASCVRLALHDELVVTADAADEVAEIMRTSTHSLTRWTGRSDIELPTDTHPLPERWMKV